MYVYQEALEYFVISIIDRLRGLSENNCEQTKYVAECIVYIL